MYGFVFGNGVNEMNASILPNTKMHAKLQLRIKTSSRGCIDKQISLNNKQ